MYVGRDCSDPAATGGVLFPISSFDEHNNAYVDCALYDKGGHPKNVDTYPCYDPKRPPCATM